MAQRSGEVTFMKKGEDMLPSAASGIGSALASAYNRVPVFPYLDRATTLIMIACVIGYIGFTAYIFLATPSLQIEAKLSEGTLDRNALLGLLPGEKYLYTMESPDGAQQTTYYGWPIYYFSGDSAAGDVKGEGVNKLWFVAKPDYTVLFANKDNVNYLVDAETGFTLYRFSKDTADVSDCSGVCAQNWPTFYVEKIVAPSFIDAAKISNFVRPDTTSQTAFDHQPLYHFVQDKVAGDLKGQGFNGVWSTVDPFAVPAP